MHGTTLISILSIQQKLATPVPSPPLLSPDWTKAAPPESLHGRLTPSNITSLTQMCALSGGKCFSLGGILESSSGGTKTGRGGEKETVLQVRLRGDSQYLSPIPIISTGSSLSELFYDQEKSYRPEMSATVYKINTSLLQGDSGEGSSHHPLTKEDWEVN